MAKIKKFNGIFTFENEKLSELLNKSGYKTIFDVTNETFLEFKKNNTSIPLSDLKGIYNLAEQRKENFNMLFKAWKLHNDPTIKGIKKLSSDVGIKGMNLALERSIGEGSSFEDLFPERSKEGYAEAFSIQSLFSPGRYLTILYNIACQMVDLNDELYILKRRPDLKNLLLTTNNMNKEVSSLDILLDILQYKGDSSLELLKETYYPMTLPYDDDLTQINAVLGSYSTSLIKVWDVLLDKQKKYFLESSSHILKSERTWRLNSQNNKTTPSPITREVLSLTPNTFKLLVNKEVSVEQIAEHFNINITQEEAVKDLLNALNNVEIFCRRTGLSFNNLLDLTMQINYDGKDNKYKSRFVKFGNQQNVQVTEYGASYLSNNTTPLWISKKTQTIKEISASYDTSKIEKTNKLYMKFDLEKLSYPINNAIIKFNKNNFDQIKLTWNEFKIIKTFDISKDLVKIDATEEVNEVLESGQNQITLVIENNKSKILNIEENYKGIMTIDEKDTTLNFNKENVVNLASRAEKLIRLANRTGLTFEELDFLIKNSQISDNFVEAEIFSIADAHVMEINPNVNYGNQMLLSVVLYDLDSRRNLSIETYIKFDLKSFTYPIDDAKIKIRIAGGNYTVTHEASTVNDNNWSENTITWNNRPIGNNTITIWENSIDGSFVNINVTKEVNEALNRGDKEFSILIRSNTNHGLDGIRSYYSRKCTTENYIPTMKVSYSNIDTDIDIDKTVLDTIAEFVRFKSRYNITADVFGAFLGEINIYSELGKESFYEKTFKTIDSKNILPLGVNLKFPIGKQGLYESICCGGIGVTEDEFSRIGLYCFDQEEINADEKTLARLYRMGKIPHMIGLSFTEAEFLWKLMSGGKNILLNIIGKDEGLKVLDIIRETESILNWMDKYKIDIVSLHIMVTNDYSNIATPEIYNFLSKVYESVIGISNLEEQEDVILTILYKVLASDFNLKPNIMERIICWMSKSNISFDLKDFWYELKSYFSEEHEDKLMILENNYQLVKYCHKINQFVLITRFCGLNEQDIAMLVDDPSQLFDIKDIVVTPSLYLLLLLSRVKEWQQRVQVSSDEAMRYFAKVNFEDVTPEDAIKLLAHIHGWNEEYTASMSYYLFGDFNYPKNFEQVFKLETWVNLGSQLKISSRTLGELYCMASEEEKAEDEHLINSVANKLMSTAHAQNII